MEKELNDFLNEDEDSDEMTFEDLNLLMQALSEEDSIASAQSLEFHKLILVCENKSNNPNPEYQKEGDSGFDLRANLTESVTLKSLDRKLIPTGLFFEIPKGLEIQVRPRSGLALKNGISVLNTPGTVDEGYRGEVCVILINLSKDDFTVNHGDRIAQAVVAPVVGKKLLNIQMVDKISTDTERGSGGFGHTGSN